LILRQIVTSIPCTGDRNECSFVAARWRHHLMDAAGALKDKLQQAAASVGDAIDDLAGKGS